MFRIPSDEQLWRPGAPAQCTVKTWPLHDDNDAISQSVTLLIKHAKTKVNDRTTKSKTWHCQWRLFLHAGQGPIYHERHQDQHDFWTHEWHWHKLLSKHEEKHGHGSLSLTRQFVVMDRRCHWQDRPLQHTEIWGVDARQCHPKHAHPWGSCQRSLRGGNTNPNKQT